MDEIREQMEVAEQISEVIAEPLGTELYDEVWHSPLILLSLAIHTSIR